MRLIKIGLLILSAACLIGCVRPVPAPPVPVPSPTATPVISPSPSSSPSPAPTIITPTEIPSSPGGFPSLETFRGGCGNPPAFTKCGDRTCAECDSTMWFFMTGFPVIKTCDTRSLDRSPCDEDHFSCPAVKTNCKQPLDDPRGPKITVTAGDATVSVHPNKYGFTIAAKKGLVTFSVCPRKDLYACVAGSDPCVKIPLTVKSGDGCTVHSYMFPKK